MRFCYGGARGQVSAGGSEHRCGGVRAKVRLADSTCLFFCFTDTVRALRMGLIRLIGPETIVCHQNDGQRLSHETKASYSDCDAAMIAVFAKLAEMQ